LIAINYLNKDYLFSIVTLNENTGGAGGFHAGVKAAYEDGYKWFWLMDDDVEPYNNALEKLLEFRTISKCIHGKRTSPDGTAHYWEARFYTRFGIAIPSSDKSFKSGKAYCSVNVGCFEGMLIHRDIVEKIGFPDPRFFIAWDDTIYGYLASKHTDVIYVDVPVLKRKRDLKFIDLGFRKLTITSDLYRYYHTRNRGLVRAYIHQEPDFNGILFNLISVLFAIKEILRAIILELNFKAYKPILKGMKDSRSISHK
jgi:hypothetical protein